MRNYVDLLILWHSLDSIVWMKFITKRVKSRMLSIMKKTLAFHVERKNRRRKKIVPLASSIVKVTKHNFLLFRVCG